MSNQGLRLDRTSVGLTVVALFGAIFVYTFFQRAAYPLGSLFSLVGVAGVCLIARRLRAYSLVMLLVGVLALAFAVLSALNWGLGTLFVLHLFLALLGLVRGGQAYRATD